MCGICGVVSRNNDYPVAEPMLQTMNDLLQHRGPDDSGIYLDDRAGLAVRRLSVVDLATGHQPVGNEDKSIWIVFNGEIYNHLNLRKQLEAKGHHFVTWSDTEVIVHGYEEYGNDVVQHLNGMFAFAIWDMRRQRLLIARDRLGIKPLCYYCDAERLFFASELKALLAHPDVPRELDLTALDHFLTLEYVPSPYSIFQDIHKLPAGHRLILDLGQQFPELAYSSINAFLQGPTRDHLRP